MKTKNLPPIDQAFIDQVADSIVISRRREIYNRQISTQAFAYAIISFGVLLFLLQFLAFHVWCYKGWDYLLARRAFFTSR